MKLAGYLNCNKSLKKINPNGSIMMIILLTGVLSATNCAMSNGDNRNMPKNMDAGFKIEKGQSMRVLWIVAGYKRGTDDSWEKKDVDAMIFQTLDMDENSIRFAGKNCTDVVFKRQRQQLGPYLKRKYGITPQFIDLMDEEVDVVKTSCSLPGFSEYLRLSDSRLIVYIEGVFFILEPVRY
jgi:hypothetical protein